MSKAVLGLLAAALILPWVLVSTTAVAKNSRTKHLPTLKLGEWTFTPRMGHAGVASRDLVESGAVSSLAAIRTSDGSAFSGAASAAIDEVGFDEFYESPKVLGFDLGYMANERVELFGGFDMIRAKGSGFVDVGHGTSAFTFTNSGGSVTNVAYGEAIQASLEDYVSYSMKGGARYYIEVEEPGFFPFVGASFGYVRVSDVDAVVRMAQANVATGMIDYFDATNRVAGGLQAGFRYEFRSGMDIKALLDLKVQSELGDGSNGLSLVGGGNMRGSEEAVGIGASTRFRVRF
jgi:hypothetical protein